MACAYYGPEHFSFWRALYYRFTVFCIYSFFRLTHKLTIRGLEWVPKQPGTFIVAGNHTSLKDPPLMAVAVRPHAVAYMAKMELFQKPPFSWYGPLTGVFPVNRERMEKSTLRTVKSVFQSKYWALGIFPEGTRYPGEGLGEIKAGAASLAFMAKKPILPVGIYVSDDKRANVVIGEPIPVQDSLEALTQQLTERLAQLKQEAANL
jgi:1-acyl-sn-glycerol-3-phosphate acyltransferase